MLDKSKGVYDSYSGVLIILGQYRFHVCSLDFVSSYDKMNKFIDVHM